MPVNTTHAEYDASLDKWLRARDVLGGEDDVKAGGEKYLPRLDQQNDEEYEAYKARASFVNATGRTADGYLGLLFRRAPFIKLPEAGALGAAMKALANDIDMLGNGLPAYAGNVMREVISIGRAGTLVDWEGSAENRAYAALYLAENILNWRTERINGRNRLTVVVLRENVESGKQKTMSSRWR